MSPRWHPLGFALMIVLGACNDTAAPSTIQLSVQLQNAGTSDGAMLLQVAGIDSTATIQAVVAPSGGSYSVFTQLRSPTAWRVIVTGRLSDGAIVELVVPKNATASLYGGTILDVADSSFVDVAPGARTLTVTP